MNNTTFTPGIALRCSRDGTIQSWIRDDFGVEPLDQSGRMIDLIDIGSRAKVQTFFDAIVREGASFCWEFNTALEALPETMRFSGAATEESVLVCGIDCEGDVEPCIHPSANSIGEATPAQQESPEPGRGTRFSFFDELSRLNNDLVNTQRELQKKSDQLQRMNEEKNRAMGIVAHDLRNPLSIFKLFSGFLLESGGDRYENDELEILKTMSETSDSMIQMVANLLDASAIEAGRLVLETKHFDLRDLLQRVVRRMAFIATQSDVRLELKEQTDCDMHINGDEGKLEQVFCNLIDNAIRFSPPGEVVTIAISQSGSDITVSVSDAGPGIPESVVPRLFKPFAAAKSTEKSGTGLGLSIAKRVIDEHGGSIRLDSADQSGTTFLVSIPALLVAS